jgi:hypothetical protein
MHHYPKGNASCCDGPASFSRLIQIHSFTCVLPPFLSPSLPPFSHKPRARLIISAKKIVAATGIVTATTFLPEGRGAKRGIMRGRCREGGREGEREGERGIKKEEGRTKRYIRTRIPKNNGQIVKNALQRCI